MKQLKMYWLGKEPASYAALPEGFSFSNFREEKEIEDWLLICRNGLISDEKGREVFFRTIVETAGIVPERDLFFLDDRGEHIGTFTAYRLPGTETGDFHMVSIRSDYRGRSLSRFLSERAIRKFVEDGCRTAVLTTDDWRLGAIKSYLAAGWLPVIYDTGMTERWESVLNTLKLSNVQAVSDDGKERITLAGGRAIS